MGRSRRRVMWAFIAAAILSAQEQEAPQDPRNPHLPRVPDHDEDKKLPNGKSQKDEIAKQDHAAALKEAESLVSMAEELRDELKKAGNYVVPVASVKKTEEIEKLARRIRGRLKA